MFKSDKQQNSHKLTNGQNTKYAVVTGITCNVATTKKHKLYPKVLHDLFIYRYITMKTCKLLHKRNSQKHK